MIQSSAYRASYSISSYVFFCNYDSFYPKESIDSFAFPHRVGITTVVVALKLLRTMEDAYREREREREKSLLRTSLLKLATTKTTALVANFDMIPSKRYHHFRDRDSFEFFTTSGCKHRRQIDLLSKLRQAVACWVENVIISDIVGENLRRDLDI